MGKLKSKRLMFDCFKESSHLKVEDCEYILLGSYFQNMTKCRTSVLPVRSFQIFQCSKLCKSSFLQEKVARLKEQDDVSLLYISNFGCCMYV